MSEPKVESWITERRLSDGSKVYSVLLSQKSEDCRMEIECVSETAANHFLGAFQMALELTDGVK